jgi:HEAT repeat protein
MNDSEMRSMLIDYMGRGFLENIIALFRQDASLYKFIADMLGDDNIRVRLGATALAEELARERREELKTAVPGIVSLLGHDNPTIRGDAVFVLGIIGGREAQEALQACLQDRHAGVREAAREALEEIG